eukprot:6467216-Amphidinium_carterae.2
MSAGFCEVCTFPMFTRPWVIKFCTYRNDVWMCFVLPSPLRYPIAAPEVASIHTLMLTEIPQSLSNDCSPNASEVAVTSP